MMPLDYDDEPHDERDYECNRCFGAGCPECAIIRRAMRAEQREDEQEQLLERMESE